MPHLALSSVAEDLRAVEVGFRRIGKRAIIERRKIFADGVIPRLALRDVQRGAFWNNGENFLGGNQRHAHAAKCGGRWLHETPVDAVGWLKFHPISHRIAGVGLADPASVGLLRVNGKVTLRGRAGGFAHSHGRGDQNFVSLDYIQPLSAGADFYFHCGGIFWGSIRRVEFERVGMERYSCRFASREAEHCRGRDSSHQTVESGFLHELHALKRQSARSSSLRLRFFKLQAWRSGGVPRIDEILECRDSFLPVHAKFAHGSDIETHVKRTKRRNIFDPQRKEP